MVSPKNLTTGGGALRAGGDPLYDIYQRIGSIQASMTFLVAAADDSKSRIESVAKDVAEGKAMFQTLITMVKWVRTVLWTLICGGCVIGGTIFTMWLKHKMGW